MNLLDPENVGQVARTSRVFDDVKMWVEEAIFGHRLYARQNPWLLFLEFMNVAEAHHREGSLFALTEPEISSPYSLRWRMGLRSVLFDNSQLGRLAEEKLDDESLWQAWFKEMSRAAAPPAEGFEYLKQRFPRFQDFVELHVQGDVLVRGVIGCVVRIGHDDHLEPVTCRVRHVHPVDVL